MDKVLATFTLFVLCALTSCKKSDSPDDIQNSRFTWEYDGTSYVAKHHKAVLVGMGAPYVSATLLDNPDLPANGPAIHLTNFEKGTYDFGGTGKNFIYYTGRLGAVVLSVDGNAVITDKSENYIGGTFTATLSDNKVITGAFVNSKIHR